MRFIYSFRLIWVLGALLAALYSWMSSYIDFHPDESIYFGAIPVSLRNDSGAFYSAFYELMQHWLVGPVGARIASALLGGGVFVVIALSANMRQQLRPQQILLLFAAFALSYQAIFVFVRVRPEAAWWFCAAWSLYAVARIEAVGLARAWPLLLPILLLPMNHRLSWFACAFLAGYALLFVRREAGWWSAISLGLTLLFGALLNIILRAWWADLPLSSAFATILAATGGQRQAFREFVELVFHGAPLFLNDTAQNANVYEWLVGSKVRWLSHAFVQNSLWALMVVLPFIGRTWKERYLFTFPLFGFLAFWLSGYYNPTYAAGFSLYCVTALTYVGIGQAGWQRKLAIPVLVLSLLNGASFIGTRILNHGEATYFSAERTVNNYANKLSLDQKIAIPERFVAAITGLGVGVTVNFKADVPLDVDVLVIDGYDELMYGFVPDFETKKLALHQQAARMCLDLEITTPVYMDDQLFSDNLDKALVVQGSWFFRNSSAYTLSIFVKCREKHEPD